MTTAGLNIFRKTSNLFLLMGALFAFNSNAQQNKSGRINWSLDPFENKEFIENAGQFFSSDIASDDSIYFAVTHGLKIYFTKSGIVYRNDELKHKFSERQIERLERKGNVAKAEAAEKELVTIPHFLRVNFIGANPNVEILAQEQLTYYRTYPDRIAPFSNKTIHADLYKKITYKNLYPKIDVEFYFPKGKPGIKYNIILHPGADVSVIRIKYSGHKNILLNDEGNVVITSDFGDFIDHAPVSYENGKIITSSFVLNGAVQSFSVKSSLSKNTTVVIDPWVTNPNLTGLNRVYDVSHDKNGNVFGYGGAWPTFECVKLNSAGVIQWKFTPTVFGSYYGDFLVDYNSGMTYMFDGFNFSGAPAVKINGAGVQVASFAGTSDLSEFWRAAYNNCTKKAVVAGGGVVAPYQACVLDSNLATVVPVNVLSAPGALHDMALLAIDNANDAYMLAARSVTDPTFADNVMLKAPAATLAPNTFLVSTNHTFIEVGSIKYVGTWSGNTNGFNGIAVNNNFLFTYDGYRLKKWNKANGAFIQQTIIGTDSFAYGGLELSECDRLYAGVARDIKMYNASTITSAGSIALTDTVYDLKLGDNNLIYASGKAYIASVSTNENCISADTLSGSVISTDVCGGTLGTAAVIATGGSGGTYYSYTWSNGQTTATIVNLSAGTYTVTVSDTYAKACAASIPLSKIFTVTINTGNPPVIDSIVTVSALCGNGNGSATAYASGVAGPILFEWGSGPTNSNTASALSIGNYTLTVSDNGACPVTGTFSISGPPKIFVNASQNKPDSCGNNTGVAVSLPSGGTGTLGITWSTGSTANTISGLASGTYSITVQDANGCIKDSTVEIGTVGAVIPNAGSDVTICRGQSTPLLASGGTTYSWSPGVSLSDPLIANPVATPTVTTNYTVTIAIGMCTGKDIVKVTVSAPPTIDSIANKNPACGTGTGSAVAYASGVTGPIICNWSNGSSGLTASGLASGSYTVTLSDNGACPVTSTFGITIPPVISATPSQSNPDTCAHNKGVAVTTISGGTGLLTPVWSSGTTGLTASALAAGNYTLTVTDANGCSIIRTTTILSVGDVIASAGPDVGYCPGGSATLSASGGTTYSWSPAAYLSDPNIANPVASPTVTTNYTVTVSVGLCSSTDVVTVSANPYPVISAGTDQVIMRGSSIQIAASGGSTYLWTPAASLSNPAISNPVASPYVTTTYTVTGTDVNGCVSTDSVTIFVEIPITCEPDDFFVPTAFSPNGDGQNDLFLVRGKSVCVKKYSFIVLDRWGEKVFETADMNEGWDGIFRGQPMNEGVYVYQLSVKFITGDKMLKSGNVTLLR